jgi:hypothetical protein
LSQSTHELLFSPQSTQGLSHPPPAPPHRAVHLYATTHGLPLMSQTTHDHGPPLSSQSAHAPPPPGLSQGQRAVLSICLRALHAHQRAPTHWRSPCSGALIGDQSTDALDALEITCSAHWRSRAPHKITRAPHKITHCPRTGDHALRTLEITRSPHTGGHVLRTLEIAMLSTHWRSRAPHTGDRHALRTLEIAMLSAHLRSRAPHTGDHALSTHWRSRALHTLHEE